MLPAGSRLFLRNAERANTAQWVREPIPLWQKLWHNNCFEQPAHIAHLNEAKSASIPPSARPDAKVGYTGTPSIMHMPDSVEIT